MSTAQYKAGDGDANRVAAQLPRITWRLLPTLLGAGILGAFVTFILLWLTGLGVVTVALYGVLVVGPTVAVVVAAIERGLHDVPPLPSRWPAWWPVRRSVAVVAWPAALVAIGFATLEVWQTVGDLWLLAPVVVATIGFCVATLGAVVAAPLAATRGDVALTSIWRVSLYAVAKAPVAPVGALSFAGITLYLALQYTVAVVLLVLPVAVVIADLAARTCAARAGVSFVPSAPAMADASSPHTQYAQRRVTK